MAGRKAGGTRAGCTVRRICEALERIAPLHLAQDWDNVGLLAGDESCPVRRVMLCIDLMPAVVAEARRRRVQFLMAYHPPIFRPIDRLVSPSSAAAECVFQCVRDGVAVFSTHTALDAADGGTNDVIAEMCGLSATDPIEWVGGGVGGAGSVGGDGGGKGGADGNCKIVTFVPEQDADRVADSMFAAGAGHIGDYQRCSFRSAGVGTFWGGETTRPAVGQAGRFETVDEIRLEVVLRSAALPDVVAALRRAHPYEEPAFDVYPLRDEPLRGIGRVGTPARATTAARLARALQRKTGAVNVQLVGSAERVVRRVIVCVGSAGTLPFKVGLGAGDVVVTGEIRHHDALAYLRRGAGAIALGHWASERPVLAPLAGRLADLLESRAEVLVSKADADPFARA